MTFAIVLVFTVAACFALRNPLRAWPWAFYVLAFAFDVVFFAGVSGWLPRAAWSAMLVLMQKCMLPLALFAVVMYLGVLPSDVRPSLWLKPVRAELSVIAWILSLGHVVVYAATYLPRIVVGGPVDANVGASFVVAVVLLALLMVLGATSFNVVKKRMNAAFWKKVQRLAYPFFLLVYVHVLLMLLPSALRGGIASGVSVAVYSVMFLAYFILRIVRARGERRARRSEEAAG
ncbi:ferric reductase-like transmembrane domain-containing protein [Gordonibacter sp.]|uniref:ferric reductase-like transmembrane domain-containing protein n=1 Tax=Gordonibacter sp. TaxID=1968902 RepID=UPI002FC8D67C